MQKAGFWQAPGASGARWFVAAMLLAIASALLPALFHSGLPATRLVGSAFDPSSVSVSLRGRDQTPVRISDAAGEADVGTAERPSEFLASVPATVPATTWIIAPSLAGPAFQVPTLAPLRVTEARPRAPPYRA